LEIKDWERAFLSVIPKRKLQEGSGSKEGSVIEAAGVEQEDEIEETDGSEMEGTNVVRIENSCL